MKYFFEELLSHLEIEDYVNYKSPDPRETSIFEAEQQFNEHKKYPLTKSSFPHPHQYSDILIKYCENYIRNSIQYRSNDNHTYEIYQIRIPSNIFDTVYDKWFNEVTIEVNICLEKFFGAYKQERRKDFYDEIEYRTKYIPEVFPIQNIEMIENNKITVIPMILSAKCTNDSVHKDDWKKILTEKFFHEMHHAYTDYKLKLNNEDTFITYQQRKNYKEVVNTIFDKDSIRYTVAKLAYYCFDFELNAFVAELNSVYDNLHKDKIKNLDFHILSNDEALQLIENTETYKMLLEFENLVHRVKSATDDEKKLLLDIWNKLQPDHQYSHIKSLIDFIEYKYNKFTKKCISVIARLIKEKQLDEAMLGVF